MMIEKIEQLKNATKNNKVKSLCENAISTITSGIYNNIPKEAKYELEKAVIESLFNNLGQIKDKSVNEWLSTNKRIWSVQNLGIKETANKLIESAGEIDPALKETVSNFKEQAFQTPEVLLYESYLSALQSFSYFPEVTNAIKAVKDRIDNYKSDVDINKVLESMKNSTSAYLVPIIEDLVENYLENKNIQTKSSLKEGLVKFSYDPFVRDLINLVSLDASELQLEHVNESCDIEKIYSPILYLGENEAIFSIKNNYYIKKGNNISVLNEAITQNLDPEFKQLCEALAQDNIVIKNDTITIYEGEHKAIIAENSLNIDGEEWDSHKFNEAVQVANYTGLGHFLNTVNLIKTNFNEIAEIDFAKRVYLKENEGYAADVFKLRDNVSIATFNPEMGKNTFYRNINPIQAKNVMLEHLKFDVSSLFKSLLPNEKKILAEINETKKEYNKYIQHLQDKINNINSLNEEFHSPVNQDVIKVLEEELYDVQNEFKDYLNSVEEYTKPLNEAQVTLEINGPLQIEVDGQKFTVPIPAAGQAAPQFQAGEVSSQDQNPGLIGSEESNITFDPQNAEATGNNPSIEDDQIDLEADKVAADADAEDAEKAGDEVGAEDADKEAGLDDAGATEEGGDEDVEDAEDDFGINLDKLDDEGEDKGEDKEEKHDKKKKKKHDKNESATSSKPAKKRKVYLKRKK